ncbi:MAG: tRNA (adenosine(37)-N6)-threonylcarbamoyltransferase complex transferase subunit TsaD [Spirochaetales bacterium]|nr:tRNA (adenosine(37)-N6)-threonylcarbamoyltransferase complex transferase subunit TsaD [Spirochaetales bacterium]
MNILGIESSCDECSAAIVQDGRRILSNVVASQIDIHRPYNGVVPELASRTHTEWISATVKESLDEAGLALDDVDGIAVTNRPGLLGALLVGISFAKGLAFSRELPLVGVDHIRAHLYAPQLEHDIAYPFIGLLVSGGHTIISRVNAFDDIEVMGTTIDDACGEAFDKVAAYYKLGYPGGVVIDKMSKEGDAEAFRFPDASLHKGQHVYDVSYSGLKTAVINQISQFRMEGKADTTENIVASFQKAAIDMLLKRVEKAVDDTGIRRIVAGGGVAANSYLRSSVNGRKDWEVYFPSLGLCTDNAAMVAGIGYHYLKNGMRDDYRLTALSRVQGFKKNYP